MTRQLLISKKAVLGTNILRHYLYHNKFSFIEDADNVENSVFLMEYLDFMRDAHCDIFFKLSKPNNYILIRHDFGVNIKEFSIKIHEFIKNYNLESKNIFIQLALNSDKEKLEKIFSEFYINNIKIFVYEPYMDLIYQHYKLGLINYDQNNIKSKFSVFSRRYCPCRFILYLELLKRNLLKEFFYTFTNCHAEIRPYPYTDIEIPELIKFITEHNYNSPHIIEWVNNLPYADLENFRNPYDNSIYKLLSESSIHIVNETATMTDKLCCLILTEKTYKPIILKKPFYLFGTSNALAILKDEGFKSFSPFLNEEYSLVSEDTFQMDYCKTKVNRICDDIERINNLNSIEFEKLMNELNSIAEYNFNHFLKLAQIKEQNAIELVKHLELV